VPAIFGNLERHDHEVGNADRDLLVTSRTQIRLARLKRMDQRDLEVVAVVRAHVDQYRPALWRPSKSSAPAPSSPSR
jgi:hypothetical protein